jgi:hypothetical protein
MYRRYSAVLKVIVSTLCLLAAHTGFSQSIRINLPEYNSFCSGTTLEVPVTMQGIWVNSEFIAKFELNTGDTTFYITAENTTSPLKFKIPALYADPTHRSRSWRLSISATLPEVTSFNTVYTILNTLPTVRLGNPLHDQNYNSSSLGPINEYVNPGDYKLFNVDSWGMEDANGGFKLNDSITYTVGSYGYQRKFSISPVVQKTYKITSAWNNCGAARIIPHEFTIKINPFENMVTNVFPKVMCDARDLNLTFDYKGTYNSDNVFTIEIANQVGDTVRQVPTTLVGDKKLMCVLDNTFRPGYYYVRVKSSSPAGTASYKEFRILRMKAAFNWVYLGDEPTSIVDYKQKLSIWVGLQNANDPYDPKVLAMRLSDGTLIKTPEYTNIYGNMYAVDIYPDQNRYYTIDSLITTCGVVKNFDMINPKYITVTNSNSFSISGLKKAYCLNERVKLKINSLVNFNNDNQFTVKVYQYNTLIGNFPVSVQNDSLSFMLSFANNSEPSLDRVQIRIESSSPVMHSTSTDGFFYIYKKPTLNLNYSTYNLQNAGHFYLSGSVYSHSPASLVINNGQKDTTIAIQNNETYIYYTDIAKFFVKNSTTFTVTSATNSCGTNQLSLPGNQTTVTVNSPNVPKIAFTSPQKPICINTTTPVYFEYAGNFNNDNTFIIYSYNSNYEKIEVGRGKTSPIMVTLPGNVYLYSPRLLIESTSPAISGYYNVSELPIAIHKPDETTFRFSNSYINDAYVNISPETRKADGGVDIIKGEKFIQGFEATVYGYQANRFRVNNQWFTEAIVIKPARDTTLFLQSVENACGLYVLRDTVNIKVKKFRVRHTFLEASSQRCMDDMIDVSLFVEGEAENRPSEFKFDFIPDAKPDSKFAAEIISKNGVYRLRIPDIPYERSTTLKITPTARQADFAKVYELNSIWLEKRHIAKLTAMDGSDTIWANPYQFYAPERTVQIKIETLNSYNPNWAGTINTLSDRTINPLSKIFTKPVSFESSSRDNYDYGSVEISSGRSTCGFTRYSGKVFFRKCIGDVTLNRDEKYNEYLTEKFFSTGSIQSNEYYTYMSFPYYPLFISGNRNVLFSAKKSILLMPGFTANTGSVFKAEIKGCTLTPTN